MEIWKQLEEATIRLGLNARDKSEVIAELADALIRSGRVDPEVPVIEEVLRREQVLSTGVGNGVALPHARLDGYRGSTLAFGRPVKPLDVGAVDGQPADLFFLLIGDRRDPSSIVRILGRIARLCDDPSLRAGLRSATDPSGVIEVLRSHESSAQTAGRS